MFRLVSVFRQENLQRKKMIIHLHFYLAQVVHSNGKINTLSEMAHLLNKNDSSLGSIDILLGENDISLGANDKSLETKINRLVANVISLGANETSFKYC